MTKAEYIHGYDPVEQRRLVEQAEYWRDRLILPGLDYAPGEKLLEVGCAAGASLAVLGAAFPGVELAGVDISPEQIAFARRHLDALGLRADLRVADAAELPWRDAHFDHIYTMWLFEHLRDPGPALAEAQRVLVPGGTLSAIETDYTTFRSVPIDADFDALAAAQRALFERNGNPYIGRRLGTCLHNAGFVDVTNQPVGFHFFNDGAGDGLRGHADYIASFLAPQIPQMVEQLGCDRQQLEAGLCFLRALPEHPDASLTQIVYKARARRSEAGADATYTAGSDLAPTPQAPEERAQRGGAERSQGG